MPKCNGPTCKAEIEWAINPETGKKIPLQQVQTWHIMEGLAKRGPKALIQHHLTCPDVNQFSKRKPA